MQKIHGATDYAVYGCKCGQHKAKKPGTVAGTTFTWNKRKSGKYYKVYVVAMNGRIVRVAVRMPSHS